MSTSRAHTVAQSDSSNVAAKHFHLCEQLLRFCKQAPWQGQISDVTLAYLLGQNNNLPTDRVHTTNVYAIVQRSNKFTPVDRSTKKRTRQLRNSRNQKKKLLEARSSDLSLNARAQCLCIIYDSPPGRKTRRTQRVYPPTHSHRN